MTSDTESLRDFARRYTDAWCSQDPASVAAFFAPHGSLRVNGDAPAVGRDAITNVARGFMTAFPDLRVLLDDLSVDGYGAVYEWTLVGTNTGPGEESGARGRAPTLYFNDPNKHLLEIRTYED